MDSSRERKVAGHYTSKLLSNNEGITFAQSGYSESTGAKMIDVMVSPN